MDVVIFYYDNWFHGGGLKYRDEYIARFISMCKKYISDVDKIILYTDDLNYKNNNLVVRYLPKYMRSWKPKEKIGMNLKRMIVWDKNQDISEEVLVIDLDVVIKGNLKLNKHQLMMNLDMDGKGPGGGIYYSSNRSQFSEKLWEPLKNFKYGFKVSKGGRDRIWTHEQLGGNYEFFQKKYPGLIVSYKLCRKNPFRLGKASIVWYHGHPKPHEARDRFTKKYWR